MYEESLANKVREYLLAHKIAFNEKKSFQGSVFMVDDKMCIGVRNAEIMCRVAPEKAELEL